MLKPYMEDNILHLSKTYKFGSSEISQLTFGELTAAEMGEITINGATKFKEFFPIISKLTGVTPSFVTKLSRQDIMLAVEHVGFLLAE